NYKYTVLAQAVRGRVTVDWKKLETEQEQLRIDYAKNGGGCFLMFCSDPSYSHTEGKKQFKFLEDRKIIVWDLEETLQDERSAKIRDAFLQYLLNLTSQPPPPEAPPPADADKDKDQPNVRQGRKYSFSRSSMKRAFERKYEQLDLNVRLS